MRSDLLWCAIVARMKAPMNVSAARAQCRSGWRGSRVAQGFVVRCKAVQSDGEFIRSSRGKMIMLVQNVKG